MTDCACRCHGNGAYPLPCDMAGGCGPHDQHRCERAGRCYARVRGPSDTMLGAPSDRPLCDTCTAAVDRALDDAPDLYVRLRGVTLQPGQAETGEKVTRSTGSPLPLNARALHLAEDLAWLLCAWEDEVRVIASLTELDRSGVREGPQVAAAARLLSAHLSAWIAAPSIAFSIDRWADELEQSGAQAAAALLEWRTTVRTVPGLDVTAPKATRRYQQPCPACGVRAVTHRAGDDLMHCQSCGATQEFLPTLPQEADYGDTREARPMVLVPRPDASRHGPDAAVAGQDARRGAAAHAFEESA